MTVGLGLSVVGVRKGSGRTRRPCASRRSAPVAVPASHRWKVVCRERGLRVDEQITRVARGLWPHAERVVELARWLEAEEGSGGAAVLQVVRYVNDSGEATGHSLPVPVDQPNLFGWHRDRDVLDFLAATRAVLDVDEYDMTPEAAKD
ncbi:DUF4279 domain-containing protein [Streptomyces sp. NPDC008343]|uniref:DUF4279 domain-containing protein n=1 Tax=Streptomyces sp. NPDC008343 TaxID=3364828 RepID=UPI0036E7982C